MANDSANRAPTIGQLVPGMKNLNVTFIVIDVGVLLDSSTLIFKRIVFYYTQTLASLMKLMQVVAWKLEKTYCDVVWRFDVLVESFSSIVT